MKNKFLLWRNHHPIRLGYCLSLILLTLCGSLNVNGALLNIVLIYLSIIWIATEARAQLSSKKRAIDLVGNTYADQVDFKISLYINDIFFALLAVGNLSNGGNKFLGFCLLVIIIGSIIPFNYQDDEYRQMLRQSKEGQGINNYNTDKSSSHPSSKSLTSHDKSYLTIASEYLQPAKSLEKDPPEQENKKLVTTNNAPIVNKDKKGKLHNDILYVNVAGTKYYELKKAVNYARRNQLFFDTYDDLSASEIREDLYTDDDPVYETDMSYVIDKITLEPDLANKYDYRAIKIIIHIGSQTFMIGYVPEDSLDAVWRILKKVKYNLMTVNIRGYMDGGKYKAVDLNNHIYIGEKPRSFTLIIETTETSFANTKKGVSISKALKQMKPLVIHKMRKPLTSFVVVDIETTGLNAPNDKVIQLSAIKYISDKMVDSFNCYVNPGKSKLPLSDFTTKLTGIKTSDVENAPSLSDIKDKFIKFVGHLPWVGHNIFHFDIPFLYNSDIGINEFYAEDTYTLAKKKLDRTILGNLKLPTIKKYYGIQGASHNALADCKTAAIVYRRLRDTTLPTTILNKDNKLSSLKDIHFLAIGSFPEMTHTSIIQQIKLRDGIVDLRWNKQTKYLVNGITSKSYKSIQQSKDHNVIFLNFPDFVNLLDSKDKQSAQKDSN